MKISTPGYYDLPLEDYLADPCEVPSLSTQTVITLCRDSALHAKYEHVRFGGAGSAPSPRADLGSAVHSVALGGNSVVYADPQFEDWRKKDAQTFRDNAHELKQIPLLFREQFIVEAAATQQKLALVELGPYRTERTIVYELDTPNGPVWLRGRADVLDDAGLYDDDVKTVDRADAVDFVKHTVVNAGLEVQMAIRHLGHLVLTGKPRQMRWRLQEINAPYDHTVIEVGEELLENGIKQVKHAAAIWADCLRTNIWPGRQKLSRANAPSWQAWDLEARGIR